MAQSPIDTSQVKWDSTPDLTGVKWDDAPAPKEKGVLERAAPYYMGPAAPMRVGADILKFVDDVSQKVGYKSGEVATDIATGVGASPETAASVGVGANMVGQGAVGAGVGSLFRAPAAVEKVARGFMQSAVKPERAMRLSGKADDGITTLMERRVDGTGSGVDRLKNQIDDMEATAQGVLNSSNATVDVMNRAMQLQNAVNKIRRSPYAAEEFQVIKDAFNRFLSHPEVAGKSQLTVAAANELKRGFYNQVGSRAYGTGDAAKEALLNAERLANKTMGESLRQGIAAAEPRVVPTLKEQSELINALKVLEPRASVEGNKNIVSFAAFSPSLKHLIVWLADRSPWFKSKISHELYHSRNRLPQELATAAVVTESGARGRTQD